VGIFWPASLGDFIHRDGKQRELGCGGIEVYDSGGISGREMDGVIDAAVESEVW
jgi:hypothetical protein